MILSCFGDSGNMECYFLGDILAATDTFNSSSVTVIRTATLRYRLWDNLLGFCNIRKHEFSAVRSRDIADGYDSREVLILRKWVNILLDVQASP